MVLSIDRRAPLLTIQSPRAGSYLPAGTGTAAIRGAVVDFGAGISSLTCNGSPATVAGQSYACSLAVTAGPNSVHVVAADAVGHQATRDLAFTVGEPPAPTTLEISPHSLTLLTGQSADLRVTDERGTVVSAGTWTSSAPLVASVVEEEERPKLNTYGAGQATLTLTRDGLTAEATVNVLAAGSPMPEGTVRWQLHSDGSGTPTRAQVLRNIPGATSPADADRLFFVDEATEWSGGTLARVAGRQPRIIATSLDGARVWAREISDGTIKDVAVDMNGGLLLVLSNSYGSSDPLPERVERIDGVTGEISWQYFTDDGQLSEVAVRRDGAVFFVDEEYHKPYMYLVAVDGQTGLPAKTELPHGHVTRTVNGIQDVDVNDWAKATAPVILADGTTTVVSSRANSESHLISKWNGSYWDVYPDSSNPGSEETHVDLVSVASDSLTPSALELTVDASIPTGLDLSAWRIIPRPNGGFVVGGRSAPLVARIDAGVLSAITSIGPTGIYSSTWEVEYAVGDTNAYALVRGYSSGAQRADLVTFDPATEAPTGQQQLLSPDARLRFIQADDGVHVSGSTYGAYDANDTEVTNGLWASFGNAPTVYEGAAVDWLPSSGYLPAGDQSANAEKTFPRVSYFMPYDQLDNTDPIHPYLAQQFKSQLNNDFAHFVTNAIPKSFVTAEATVANFRKALNSQDIVIFLGHSLEHPVCNTDPTDPNCQAYGLILDDKDLIMAGWGSISLRPTEQKDYVDHLEINAKVLMIGSCAISDIFKGMWAIDQSTTGHVLVYPTVRNSHLLWAAQAAELIAQYLTIDKLNVAEAISKVNTEFLQGDRVDLKFTFVGDGNVNFR